MTRSVELGKRLRLLREAADLSRSELAARAGLNRNTVINVETGDSAGRGETLPKLAKALQVDPAAFESDQACIREIARLVGAVDWMVGAAKRRAPPATTLILSDDENEDAGVIVELQKFKNAGTIAEEVKALFERWPELVAAEYRATNLPKINEDRRTLTPSTAAPLAGRELKEPSAPTPTTPFRPGRP